MLFLFFFFFFFFFFFSRANVAVKKPTPSDLHMQPYGSVLKERQGEQTVRKSVSKWT